MSKNKIPSRLQLTWEMAEELDDEFVMCIRNAYEFKLNFNMKRAQLFP
ncbi:MAG: hypothetical protein ACE5K0_10120 [Candidatus Methanofastidiosia archaeon]